MYLFDQLDVTLRLENPGFVLFHDEAILPERICSAIRTHLKKPVVVRRLNSDSINFEEGALIQDTLLSGEILLLITRDAKRLPSDLLKAWQLFHQYPRDTQSGVGRFIRFQPRGGPRLGMLGLILPKDYELLRSGSSTVIWLETNNFNQSLYPDEPALTIGRSVVPLAMKDLYFLHHRDALEAVHHGSIADIHETTRPLTWTDLQRLLCGQADADMLEILDGYAKNRRLSAEQMDVAAAAISYLREERRERERIGGHGLAPTIYHLLWIYSFLEMPDRVFRGQRDSRWRQETSLLRAEKDGTPSTLDTIMARVATTEAFLQALAAEEVALVGQTLDEDARLAIAQHYGMPTPLLDYTRSLAVAAFFATGAGNSSVIHDGDIGVIYYISPDDPVAGLEKPIEPTGLDVIKLAGLKIGELRTIEPKLPDSENRIARQKGVFVDGFVSRDLQRLTVGVLYFRQKAGEAFEDSRAGITRERLLTPDSQLERLAKSITINRTPTLSKRLTDVRWPSDDIFGGIGLMLNVNLYKSQEVLNELADRANALETGLWGQIKEILQRHINEAKIAASTAEVAPAGGVVLRSSHRGISRALDEVDIALEELANLSEPDRVVLLERLRACRPATGLAMRQRPVEERITLPSATPKAHVILAAGLFIVGLEYLRTVRGNIAMHYIEEARMEVLRSKDTWFTAGSADEGAPQ